MTATDTTAAAADLTEKQREAIELLAAADPEALRVAGRTVPGGSINTRTAAALDAAGLAKKSGNLITLTDDGRALLVMGQIADTAAEEPPARDASAAEPCPDPDCRGDLDGDGHCSDYHDEQPPDPADYGVGPVVDACRVCGEDLDDEGHCADLHACADCGGQVFDDDGDCVPCQVVDSPAYQPEAPRFPDGPDGRPVHRGSARLSGTITDLPHGPDPDQAVILIVRARPSTMAFDVDGHSWKYTLAAGEDVYELTGDAIAAWCRDEDLPDLTPEAILRAAQRHAAELEDRRHGRTKLPLDCTRGGEPAHVSQALVEIAEGLNREELEARDEDGRRLFDDDDGLLVGVLHPPDGDGQWELRTDNAAMPVGFDRAQAEAQARAWFGESVELQEGVDGTVGVMAVDQDELLEQAGATEDGEQS